MTITVLPPAHPMSYLTQMGKKPGSNRDDGTFLGVFNEIITNDFICIEDVVENHAYKKTTTEGLTL